MPTINRCGGGGGTAPEIFNFPLTISSTQPNPLAVGHLWVEHASATDFSNVVLDDAVKVSYTNGYLMLIVDDTNNGQDTITQPKLVGGVKLPFMSVRDTANDSVLPWQVGSVNKGGTITDIKRKYPLVYSRLGDVLDLETASVWDGAQWVLVSQQGSYLAVGTSGTPYSNLYNRIGNSLAIHAGLPSFPAGQVNVVKWSKDGLYVFYGLSVSPWVVGYKRIGDVFSQITFTVHQSGGARDIDISSDGIYMAVAQDQVFSIYKKQSDGSFSWLNTQLSTSYIYWGCSWSLDGNYVIATSEYSPYIWRFKRTGDTFALLANPTTLPTGACYKCKYSPDGQFVAVRSSTAPKIAMYHIVSDTQWDKLTDPSTPVGWIYSTENLFFNSSYLIVPDYQNSHITFYTFTSTALTYVTMSSNLGMNPNCGAINVANQIAIGGQASPYLKWYSLSGTTLTPLTSPTTMPTSLVRSLDFLN